MAQSEAIGELMGRVMDRSEAYANAMDLSRIGMTWAGLADAVGMAEAVLLEDDPILVGYRNASIHLAGSLRPSSMASWHERKDAYRDMRQKETSERERYMAMA